MLTSHFGRLSNLFMMLTGTRPKIVGNAVAVSENSYTPQELLDIFAIDDEKVRSVFCNSAIERRNLTLPPIAPDGRPRQESQGELLRKHSHGAVDMGARAVQTCLKRLGADLSDVKYLCCVTTTGFLTPGLSARLIKDLGLDPTTSRLDVVGMAATPGSTVSPRPRPGRRRTQGSSR